MQLANPATNETITIRADNLVERDDGSLWVESMFSGIAELSTASDEVIARLHPVKAKVFEWIVAQESPTVSATPSAISAPALKSDPPLKFVPDVQIHVPNPAGGQFVHHFSDLRERSRKLTQTGAEGNVRNTIYLEGFDPGAEPVVRELRDESWLLIFGFIPPLVTERDPAKARSFDRNTFDAEVEKALGVPVAWDDREIFVIRQPATETLDKIRQFVRGYWDRKQRPWWKVW